MKLTSIAFVNSISKIIFSIIEREINTQKVSILDRIENRKKHKLEKSFSEQLFASPQLPPKHFKGKQFNEIKETEEENKEPAFTEMESNKRKRKSILMLRKVSNELTNMIENLNFGSSRKLSIKKGSHVFDKDNSFKENKIAMNMEESLKFMKIEEVINENP